MNNTVTCIIPFLNERERIGKVLEEIIKVKNIDQIICVDGGSTDGGFKEVEKQLDKKIELLQLLSNIGKSGTIEYSLNRIKNDFVLLYDADLDHVDFKEIELVIDKIINSEKIDMIIFNRDTPRLITKINRMELIFSGERILKTKDLKEIFKTHPVGFQLETAINTYMIKNRKDVYYFNSSNTNLPKVGKFGSLKGIIRDIQMFWEVFKYNPISYFYQLLFFARKKI